MEELRLATTRRSLRAIRTELEYLTDTNVITSDQYTSILSQLPEIPSLSGIPSRRKDTSDTAIVKTSKSDQFAAAALTEKVPVPSARTPSPSQHPPPPSYAAALPNAPLALAEALYAYNATDVGDVALLPNDRVAVSEYVNPEWWKGRNERTGQEGIFPRSYVKLLDEKILGHAGIANAGVLVQPPPNSMATSSQDPGPSSKFNEQGKKFGKKMGNATIFGAGATMGSKIVNGIF
ncbi:MAG: hypothetical protein M1817_002265 [Caeruleum heppii]|nr:MAG: hypothetical protein M1817_002265 [Caeruleum heppii]